MIALKRICKHYIDGKRVVTALKDVTINFDVGEFVVVTGASGSGKSTFLNILSGVDYATSGEYLINGVDTDSFDENDWNDYRCKNIGLVYQDYRLFDEFTAEENIQTALALIYSQKKDIRKHAKELMEQTGVIDFANKKVKYLSGGQKQRVAIARALAKNPNILLADEPTANLDDENAKAIVDLLKQISKDKLIVVVTHNDNILQSALTRKIVLDEGMVVSDSSPITKLQQDKENKPSSRLKSNINFGFGICENALIPLIQPYLIKNPVVVPAMILAIVRATETFLVFSSTSLLCASIIGWVIMAVAPSARRCLSEEKFFPIYSIPLITFSLAYSAFGNISKPFCLILLQVFFTP